MNSRKLVSISLIILFLSIYASGCGLSNTPLEVTVDNTEDLEVVITEIIEITKEIIITTTPVPTSIPTTLQEIIFQDDFDFDKGEWKFDFGRDEPKAYYRYVNGELEIGIAQDRINGEIYFNQPDMETLNNGYDLTFDTKLVGGDERYTTFGLNLRKNNYSFLRFSITQTGLYRLVYFVEEEWREIISWTRESALREGFNTIHIIDNGTRIKAYANDVLLFNLPVELPPVGYLDFTMEVLTDPDTQKTLVEGIWVLDNVIIREVE